MCKLLFIGGRDDDDGLYLKISWCRKRVNILLRARLLFSENKMLRQVVGCALQPVKRPTRILADTNTKYRYRVFSTGEDSDRTSKLAFQWSSPTPPTKPLVDMGGATVGGGKKANRTEKIEDGVRFNFRDEFRTHQCDPPPSHTTATKEELLWYYEQMQTIRRLEVAADAFYKAKLIRGFCHLSTGQEAVAVGIGAALGSNDAMITAYRCHGFALVGGATVEAILAELLGRQTGTSRGKGGSMHMFALPRFYGGHGIVGAQVPLGTGLAFAQKYRNQNRDRVTVALYGDGAANQGQIYEAFNLAALLRLPIIFICENNFYGMGTSIDRAAASTRYYTRGDYIPGIQVNGMDTLAVREAIRYARHWCTVLDRGPIILETVTYRYQGHSMSDPGTTYRPREEIQNVRAHRDSLKLLQTQILEAAFATEEDLRAIDRQVKTAVDAAAEQAKAADEPSPDALYKDVYVQNDVSLRSCTPPSL